MFEHFFIWEGEMEAAGVQPCGVLTPTAIAVAIVCLALVFWCVHLSRGLSEEKLNRIVLYIAIGVTAVECCKIVFNWAHGGLTPNHWLPLSYCSFAIYSYWMIACGKGVVHEAGKGFLCGGGIIAGLVFLIVPMTSVATYPMLHFLSCYSMTFHSLMMYVGLSYVINGYFRHTMVGYRRYLYFTVPACLFSLSVNLVYGIFDAEVEHCNMMFLSGPYNLATIAPFIGSVYNFSPFLYTLSVFVVYQTVPFFVPYAVVKFSEAQHSEDAETETDDVAEEMP